MTDATEAAPQRRYGNFESVTLESVADAPRVVETVAAQMRDALVQRPDIGHARLIQATVRITAFKDGVDGPTHRVDWALELPVATAAGEGVTQ